ncbi:conserved hypothetical protein [Vibrio crassostreae]|jgi:hypothetical protein|uniref:hypothetical protein n=1 Tax=Vibrio crassostreae TaxID=246167 RepID=UPI0005E912AE|nr:hypothetical protein [Vibrio crassostreae]TCT64915.1 hypothetical protein EDB44_104216 [Vibrio crassostreae]TCT85133.1 hypothetical protein EDB43_104216 [Vibrio crassostreae]TCU05161.1 hypothetical protein EDB47_106164 [Vibrio crassostreae]TDW06285.1 hypothetical protein EDB45_1206 [Vibrio crassostreae]CAK1742494.1 conserved hypothetical protein [Vibrio crassostreae]
MIWESSDWKEPLLESASRLQKLSRSNEIDESEFVQIEKDVFIGFYAIRKLMDTAKISDSTKSFDVSLKCFPNLKPVDYMNWHRLDELYDLSGKQCETKTLRVLCNFIVHSYVFMPEVNDEGHLVSFYVTSDKDRNKKLYSVSIEQVINIFKLVGGDYPSNTKMVRNPKTGDWDIQSW